MLEERKFKLTPRQCDVIRLLELGYKYQEIADKLGVKKGTVITIVSNISRKARAHGYKWGKMLIDSDGEKIGVQVI